MEPHLRQNLHTAPHRHSSSFFQCDVVRCPIGNAHWYNNGLKKWGDVSASPEEGTNNGGVHGHESRRRASAAEEYINDEVRRDGGRLPRGLGGDMARFVRPPSRDVLWKSVSDY